MRTALTALLLGAAAVVPTATSAQGLPPTVIRLISVLTKDRLIDNDPKGPSTGDVEVVADSLLNTERRFGLSAGARVGHDAGRVVLLTGKRLRMDGWADLPGGRIHVEGLVRKAGAGIVIPVVGGTGDLAGAHGSVSVTPHPTNARTLNVYRLSFP